MKIITIILALSLALFAEYSKRVDLKNVYYESTHFQVIAGLSYANDSEIKIFSYKLLDSAEISWQKIVNDLGFQAPRNSENTKIDIYIGNKNAYNSTTENIETIVSNYAGFATTYPNQEARPYIVINPILNDNQIKVTISHEFFHTVQLNYYEKGFLGDNFPNSNIWWFEATAVLIEDEVYDEVNDYLSYLNSFFNASYLSMEIYNGSHEYSTVIFAKYIKEKFGIDFIKKTFVQAEKSGLGYFELIDKILKDDYNSSMKEALKEFSYWIVTPHKYFEEGNLYPTIQRYRTSHKKDIQKGGVLVLNDLDSIYITPKNNYNIVNKDAKTNLTIERWDDAIFSNFTSTTINYESLDLRNYIPIQKGWSMVALNNFEQLDFNNIEIIWEYSDGKWRYYSKNSEINDKLKNKYEQIKSIDVTKGYWVYAKNSFDLNFTSQNILSKNYQNLVSNWNLVSTFKNIKNLNSINEGIKTVWFYKSNKWYLKSFNQEFLESENIEKLLEIPAKGAFWILK